MKLTFKLMGMLFLVILGLLALDTYLLVRREIVELDRDMRQDALNLGHVLRETLGETWRRDGEAAAQDLAGRLDSGPGALRITLARVDALPEGMTAADSLALRSGGDVSYRAPTPDGVGARVTVMPLPVGGQHRAAAVIRESLRDEAAVARRTVTRALVLGGLMLVAGVGLLVPLGIRMIGGPLHELVAKTERIGRGDLADDLALAGHDELTDLAAAMNVMCGNLAQAREQVRSETDAKLSALEQLRHAERLAMLGRIASGLAHELGTPLNVVSGRAKMIGSGVLEGDEVGASARIIGEQAERMTGIIRQLLDYARRGGARRTPEPATAVVGRSLEMLRPLATKTGAVLRAEAAADLPAAVVDRNQMEQVLVNLVMNAVQAMPEGGTVTVALEAARGGPDGDRLLVRVRDEGEGMPPDVLAQVFEPFFTTKQTGQGTGLGLPIVKGLVEDGGGTLDIASEVGKGTTVTVSLPLEEAP